MVRKIHAKQKRMQGSPTHLRSIRGLSRNRAKRPRTFTSEAAAKSWAEKNGIKKFELVNIKGDHRADKKIKIMPQ